MFNRKLTKMDKQSTNLQRTKTIEARVSVSQAKPATKELVAPEDWDSLLNGFDSELNESTAADKSESARLHDDLFAKLSSTRWVKKRPIEAGVHSQF